jgi:hypothetical protein
VTGPLMWFSTGRGEAGFVARVADVLRDQHGLESEMVTPYATTQELLQELGHTCHLIRDLVRERRAREPQDVLAAADALLGADVDLNMLIHSDQILSPLPDRDLARELTGRGLLALDELLEQRAPRACLRYGGGAAYNRGLGILAHQRGIASFIVVGCPPDGTCGLAPAGSRDERWTWCALPRTLEAMAGRELTPEDRARVDGYIQAYFDKHQARPRLRVDQTDPDAVEAAGAWSATARRHLNTLVKRNPPLQRLVETVSGGPAEVTYDRAGLADGELDSLIPLWEDYARGLRAGWLETYPAFTYDEPPAERYVYMPLQAGWDMPHRAWRPMNYMQEFLVRVANASLPTGYRLVIKEHPYAVGELTHDTLRSLQAEGVLVSDPRAHSLSLVQGASAVFCVGDTTGWEGVFFKIPVVVFDAFPFYTDYPVVRVVESMSEVHGALRAAVRAGPAVYDEDPDARYKFVLSVLESAHPGNVFGYKNVLWYEKDESQENVAGIAGMIVGELAR